MNLLKRLIKDEEGQGLVEYALIIGLISLVVVAVLTLTGTSIKGLFNKINNTLDAV